MSPEHVEPYDLAHDWFIVAEAPAFTTTGSLPFQSSHTRGSEFTTANSRAGRPRDRPHGRPVQPQ